MVTISEVVRWARAMAAPASLAGVLAALAAGCPAARLAARGNAETMLVWRAAVAVVAVWFTVRAWRCARRPALDRQAAERVQDLRDRAVGGEWSLVCVVESGRFSPAGQHVSAIDIRTGLADALWLPEDAGALVGTYMLVHRNAAVVNLVDRLGPAEIAAARRADAVRAAKLERTKSARARKLRRRARRSARAVVRAAERLLH